MSARTGPTLTVYTKTANSGDRLEQWIARVREFADEVVLLVDDTSADDTLQVALANADVVQVFEHAINNEACLDYGARLASSDWIMMMDDDEVMGPRFPGVVAELIRRRDVTHYWLPYRWLVPLDDGCATITSFPWHPDQRLRLWRNVPSIFWHRGRPHSPLEVLGDGEVVTERDAIMWHLDFLYRDRAAREEKVERYRQRLGPSCEEFYLWEDYEATLKTEPCDIAEIVREPNAAAAERVNARRARGRLQEPTYVTAAELRRSVARHWVTADVFHAEYLDHDTPAMVVPNSGYTVNVTVRNTSTIRWRNSGEWPGKVTLSYRWLHREHGALTVDTDTAWLNTPVEPGASSTVTAGVWTPNDPGHYLLQWDLRSDGLGWFSARGVRPLEVAVAVQDVPAPGLRRLGDAQLPPAGEDSLRRAARLRALLTELRAILAGRRAAAELHARNLTPLPGVRVLDTRDGSGAEGASIGPIQAGETVTLQLGGHPLIPPYARGIVGSLAILEADYNGFISAFPTSQKGGPGANVTAYFEAGQAPRVQQIVVPLGEGAELGRLSLRISDNHPGGVQLLLDLTGYVA